MHRVGEPRNEAPLNILKMFNCVLEWNVNTYVHACV